MISAHLQIAYIAFAGSQGTNHDGIMWVKVGNKLTRKRGDFQAHIHARPEALIMNTSLIIHVLKLSPVQLHAHRGRSLLMLCVVDTTFVLYPPLGNHGTARGSSLLF